MPPPMMGGVERSPRQTPPPSQPERRDEAPWRVEGKRQPQSAAERFRPPGGRRFWIVLAVLLAINWYVGSQVQDDAPQRIDVSYTFFREQGEDGNVQEVTSTEDTIQGEFEEATRDPSNASEEQSRLFETQRPAFA